MIHLLLKVVGVILGVKSFKMLWLSVFLLGVFSSNALLMNDGKSKLGFTYFDARGRGEITRLLFAAAHVQYDETRIQQAEWPTIKPKMPFGHVPILNVSGTIYAESLAIQAYIARENGMYGDNNLENLLIDELAMAREDLLKKEAGWSFNPNATLKAQLGHEMYNNIYPMYLGAFESALMENPMHTGYVIRDKLTLADIVIFEGSQTLFQNDPAFLNNYPKIQALRTKVAAVDGISQYLAARPKFIF